MDKMKCGFVISFNGPYYSNFVASIISLEENMQQSNIETVYIFPTEVKDFDWIHKLENLTKKIYYLDFRPYSFNNCIQIRRIFKKEKVNFIYSRMCGWDFAAHFALPNLPIVWHMDMNVNIVDRKRKFLNWIKFKIIGFGKTYHIGVSNAVTDEINSLNPKNKCVSILNSLDFSRLNLKNEQLISTPYKLLIFGWIPIVKGLDTTLDALEVINKDKTNIILLVSSQQFTEEYLNERYSELPKWVQILPPTDNVAELYDEADVMISASRSESFSFCLAEAIYSGLPVVVSDIVGTSWSKEFRCTYEFKTANSEDLIKCLESMEMNISQEDLDYNRDLMQEKYSMDAWSMKIINYIKEIR